MIYRQQILDYSLHQFFIAPSLSLAPFGLIILSISSWSQTSNTCSWQVLLKPGLLAPYLLYYEKEKKIKIKKSLHVTQLHLDLNHIQYCIFNGFQQFFQWFQPLKISKFLVLYSTQKILELSYCVTQAQILSH